MLKALYDYGIKNGVSIPPGFTFKKIRAYIDLSSDGSFIGIEKCDDESQICPDIGSLANSPDKCNPLAEKAEIILAVKTEKAVEEASDEKEAKAIKKQLNNTIKKQFFHSMLESSSGYSPSHAICLKALENTESFSAMCEKAKAIRLKSADRISFKVDSIPITEDEGVNEWWSEFRKRFVKSDNSEADGQSLCLITGQPTSPLSTVPKMNGLSDVGGQPQTPLFCFDKNAFQSYGFKQSKNAPVSEEAFSVVKDALNDLLNGAPAMYERDKKRKFNPTAPVFAGLKFVHWYDKKIKYEDDPLVKTVGDSDAPDDEDDLGGNDDYEEEEMIPDNKDAAPVADKAADELIESVTSGASVTSLPYEYHIMLISGANGRAKIRLYEHGSYETLQRNLALWYNDLELCDNIGTGNIGRHKLVTRLIKLMSRQKIDNNIFERMKKELSGLTPSIVMAMIDGTPLPDSVASRALAYIRSKILNPDENDKFAFMPDGIACQWLKVWLNRKRRIGNEEVLLMPTYDSNFPNAAYHCGAIMAIYADIQRKAMPEVNAGIVQRYYASASRTPSLVLGMLERMSKYHFDKINNPGLVRIYENYLNEAYLFFGKDGTCRFPTALNLEDQSYFALGYRQMSAKLIADRKEASDAKKSALAANENYNQEDA